MYKTITVKVASAIIESGKCSTCGDWLSWGGISSTHGEGEISIRAECCGIEHLVCIEGNPEITYIIREYPYVP